VFRVRWSIPVGCRDLNLFVQDPTGATRQAPDVNKGCAGCVPAPFEEISFSNPAFGVYYYRALDMAATSCNCGAAAPIPVSSTFSVYQNGVLVKTDLASSYCDSFTATFTYPY
jgi:hypothetical protein